MSKAVPDGAWIQGFNKELSPWPSDLQNFTIAMDQ